MALTHIVAHRLSRSSPTSEATVQARENPWPINGRIEEFFRELKQCVLKRSGKEYGRFSDDRANYPFASWLEENLSDKISFSGLTQLAMGHLKVEVDKSDLVFDGFIVFARETLEDADFMHIFVVQHATGQYIDGDLNISESFYLDTSGVQLASKINITNLQSGEPEKVAKSLAVLRWRGEKDLTEAFERFVGFAQKVDISADTEEFLSLVSDYAKKLPKEAAEQTKMHVVEYCLGQEKEGKPVVLEELSSQIKDQVPSFVNKQNSDEPPPLVFSDYVAQQPSVKKELLTDKTQLRNFIRISGRNDALSMSFDSSCLGETIVYDTESDSLVIKQIPSSLKARLVKHLQR